MALIELCSALLCCTLGFVALRCCAALHSAALWCCEAPYTAVRRGGVLYGAIQCYTTCSATQCWRAL